VFRQVNSRKSSECQLPYHSISAVLQCMVGLERDKIGRAESTAQLLFPDLRVGQLTQTLIVVLQGVLEARQFPAAFAFHAPHLYRQKQALEVGFGELAQKEFLLPGQEGEGQAIAGLVVLLAGPNHVSRHELVPWTALLPQRPEVPRRKA